MKITKRQLRRIIREEKTKLLREAGMEPGIDHGDTPSNPAAKARAQEILADVALFFIFKDEKNLSKMMMIEYLNSDERNFHESLKALKRLASSI